MLYKAAERRQYQQVAEMLAALSTRARDLLNDRGARPNLGIRLPSPETLRDDAHQEAACWRVATILLCAQHAGISARRSVDVVPGIVGLGGRDVCPALYGRRWLR